MSKPLTFEIPAGTQGSGCKSCGAPIYWIVTPSGKRMPCNPDGVSHFATCPHAAEHRRPR
jgi:hypothetical protein